MKGENERSERHDLGMKKATAVDHLPTPNACVDIANRIGLLLRGNYQLQGRPEDMGSSARLTLRTGSRRQPGDLHGADTVREFTIHIAETPREQIGR